MLNAKSTVGALIAARTNASRLPGKVLLEVKGKPLIEHQIERVRRARLPNLIVLCTTTSAADNQLAVLGEKSGIEVFRGNPSDVPYRLLQAAEHHELDFIVLIEGDEAFVDWTSIDALITRAHTTGADYVKTQGLPIGAWVCGMRTSALRTLCNEICTEGLDGWGSFFENQPNFYTERVQADPQTTAMSQQLRLTIDYPEDYLLPVFFPAPRGNIQPTLPT
jgi:spore coat polysaccharide biosynthesis protein SpsF